MNSSITAFLVILLGGVLAALIVKWANSKYTHPEVDSSCDEDADYSRNKEIFIGAISVFLAWMSTLWIMAWIFIYNLINVKLSDQIIFFYPLGVLIFGTIIYLYYGVILKCDRCNRRLITQDSENQKYIKKHWLFTGWAQVVIDILFKKKFQCMSCGKKYLLR